MKITHLFLFLKKNFWLVIIILLFLFTRLYKINSIPGSLYWDEASIGYNAYAIATDLKDEWGEFLPLHFRAFGEFKLPTYIYSVSIFTKIFGLNEFSVRIPSVIFSVGTVIAVYFLTLRLTKNKTTSLLSSFVLSITPWFFIFSRTGYEASAGLFFFLTFVCFLLYHQGKKVYVILAVLSAILSFYSYNSFRILIPIFLIVWLVRGVLLDKKFIKKSLFVFLSLGIFAISLIPLVKLYRMDSGAVRLTTVGIKEPKVFVKNYFSHFSYNFLFDEGDINDRSQLPGWGQMFIVSLPFLLLGFYHLLFKKNDSYWVLILFLLIGAIPAAITRESPHALRAILLAPTLSIIVSIGFNGLIEKLNYKKYNRLLLIGFVATYLTFFTTYFYDFIANYNLRTSDSWQIQYKNLFTKIKESENINDVIISDEYAQPYIFALYYLKYPPSEFRRSVKYNSVDRWGFSTVKSFGNFRFENIK